MTFRRGIAGIATANLTSAMGGLAALVGDTATVLAASPLPPAGAVTPMKVNEPKGTNKKELIGIVISGMQTPPQTTVFSAYIWGPAPVQPEPTTA